MSAIRRRSLHVDDPLGAANAQDQQHGSRIATDGPDVGVGGLRAIPLEQIRANPHQPRKRF
jgi:hypothetical protein